LPYETLTRKGKPITRQKFVPVAATYQKQATEDSLLQRLGYSSITMTLDFYSHVTPEMAKLAAESLNGLLSKRKNPAKVQGEQ